jgi:hypothetical protein
MASTARGWSRLAAGACFALWLSFAVGCQKASRGRAGQEAAVYVAALDVVFAEDTFPRLRTLLAPDTGTRIVRVYHPRDTMPRLVLVDRMGADPVGWLVMLMGVPEPPADSAAAALRELERRKVSRDLAEDFVAANLRRDSLHVPLAARPPTYFATLPTGTPEAQKAPFARRRREPDRGLGRPPYPEPSQILRLSRPGFSPDRRHALVYVETYCGFLCAGGRLVRLERDGERWRVVEMLGLWVS